MQSMLAEGYNESNMDIEQPISNEVKAGKRPIPK